MLGRAQIRSSSLSLGLSYECDELERRILEEMGQIYAATQLVFALTTIRKPPSADTLNCHQLFRKCEYHCRIQVCLSTAGAVHDSKMEETWTLPTICG